MRTLDLRLLRFLRMRGHSPPFERVVLAYTRSGEHGALWLLASGLGMVLDPGGRPVYKRAGRVVVIAYLVNIALKQIFRRRRPLIEELPYLSTTVSALSYPSAHATTSFAAARVLSDRLPPKLLYGLAIAMGLSRPYVGVHYPSDIAAGALLGTGMADWLTP